MKNKKNINKLIQGIEESYESHQWKDLARDKVTSFFFNLTIIIIIIAFIFLIIASFNNNNVHHDSQDKRTENVTNKR